VKTILLLVGAVIVVELIGKPIAEWIRDQAELTVRYLANRMRRK
jgi:hypothetical protein